MDWSFGSTAMRSAEDEFEEDVYFGVGSFGSDDQMSGLGSCFRLRVAGIEKDLIVQAINTGSDVQGNQFDLQVGDGGFGANNRCVGVGLGAASKGNTFMFPGSSAVWGEMYGGVTSRDQCAGLPEYPTDSAAMKASGDSLVALCEYSFDKKVRLDANTSPSSNPTILDLARVKCPDALVELTQIQRNDDPATFSGPSLPGFPNNGTAVAQCQHNSWDLSYCLTRMMDCAKPSGSWTTNVKESLVIGGKKVVQFCTADGYTRVDVQCGCFDCNC